MFRYLTNREENVEEEVMKNFIVLEGCEGAGKTGQLKRLQERLEECGLSVFASREPGGTPYAEKIREVIVSKDTGGEKPAGIAEFFLFMAARAQHVLKIRKMLKKGLIVLLDRFSYSTFAYQGYGRGLLNNKNENALYEIDRIARHGILPGLVILLDQDVAIGLLRRSKTGESNRIDNEKLAFHQKVREGFLNIAQTDVYSSWVVIDASRPIDQVADDIWQAVRKHLGL